MASHLMDAPDVLKKIAAYKVDEVADLKARTTIETLREQAAALPRPRGFETAIKAASGPCLLYTSPSPRDRQESRMPSSA